MQIRIIITLLLIFITSTYTYAQNFKYTCYVGKLSNTATKEITGIRIGIASEPRKASFIIFYNRKSKYSTDIFCPENNLGRCSLLDDSGSFEILSLTSNKMTIQFNGTPRLVKHEEEILPMIDSSIQLKNPIRMNLAAHEKSHCTY